MPRFLSRMLEVRDSLCVAPVQARGPEDKGDKYIDSSLLARKLVSSEGKRCKEMNVLSQYYRRKLLFLDLISYSL